MKKVTANQKMVAIRRTMSVLAAIGFAAGVIGIAASSTGLIVYGLLPAIVCMFTSSVLNGLCKPEPIRKLR